LNGRWTSAVVLAAVLAVSAWAFAAVLGVPIGAALAPSADRSAGYLLVMALLGGTAVGSLSGAVGSFAVARQQSLLGDAISHSTLPGIYGAFLVWSALGLDGARSLPVVLGGAAAAGLCAAGAVALVARMTRLKQDAATGIALSTFFAAGIAMRSYMQSASDRLDNRAGLEAYLLGSAATITAEDVRTIALLWLLITPLVLLFWKELKLLVFDPDSLTVLGFSRRGAELLLTAIIVGTVVIGLRIAGVVLMSALLIAPPVAARQWSERFSSVVVLAAFIGAFSAAVGVLISTARAGIPTGPAIAVFSTGVAVVSLAVAPDRGILAGALRRARAAQRFDRDTVLLHAAALPEEQTVSDLRAALRWPGWRLDRALNALRRTGHADVISSRVALSRPGREAADRLRAAIDPDPWPPSAAPESARRDAALGDRASGSQTASRAGSDR